MHKFKSSETAIIAAMGRALHDRTSTAPIFTDPYADSFLPITKRLLIRFPLPFGLLNRVSATFRHRMLTLGITLARARYNEDKLEDAVARGVKQYVIIGAGLDSFALRRPDYASDLTVIELDHPATQAFKRERLAAMGWSDDARHIFAPVDFERESVGDALVKINFDETRPTFFSLLGTTYYLTHDAVSATLASIAGVSSGATEMALDYWVAPELVSPSHKEAAESWERHAASIGEPVVGHLVPEQLVQLAEKAGFEVTEDLSSEALASLYFLDAPYYLQAPSFAHVAHLRRI
jgi:methyltransferase (TIGR00027 family)